MRKIKTLLLGTLTTLIMVSISTTSVFADGGYSPYNPYGPHKPVPTGFGDLDTVVAIAIAMYVAGVGFIAYSQLMKQKFLK